MDDRVTRLECELRHLQTECADMKLTLYSLQHRKQIDSTDVTFLGALITMLVLFSWLWFALG